MMKVQISLLLFLGSAFATGANFSIARAQEAAVTAPMTATQILEKSRQTYAGLQVYRGKCAATLYQINAGKEGPREVNLTSQSSLEWERGRSLHIATNNGIQKWNVEGDAKEIVLNDSGIANLFAPKREVFVDKEHINKTTAFFIAFQPNALGTGTMVYRLLENIRFLHPFDLKNSELRPADSVDGRPCYVVARREDKTNAVTTFWLDKESFLLRRMTVEQGEYAPEPIEIGGRIVERTHIMRSSTTYLFSIDEALKVAPQFTPETQRISAPLPQFTGQTIGVS